MSAIPKDVENHLKIFSSRTKKTLRLGLGIEHHGWVYSNGNPRLTFDFYSKVKTCFPIYLHANFASDAFGLWLFTDIQGAQLTFTPLWADSADDKLIIFFPETRP